MPDPELNETQKLCLHFLEDGPASGEQNMARDMSLYAKIENGEQSLYFRFYTFDPPCLSVGVFQELSPDDEKRYRELGLDMVRRPTGGRAVIHMHELTYSVVFPLGRSPFAGTIRQTYEKVSQLFCTVLNSLGVSATMARPSMSDYHKNDDCFKSPTFSELTLNGTKIMGSAQKRGKHACLQHGSLLFKKDTALYKNVFGSCPDYPEITLDPGLIVSNARERLEQLLPHT